ncbi:energy transducer TonB [Pedobacter flavus]|uniref:Energy transducer TonB n=1 Tax=Pedobacter flavus TaxID=3113906 RepID=A0ABU7H409_9SPHI|nr:energy transducer TonB [Pedobacter sp. VNH31]MEE1885996.1 energy transducer TonB [Pedobacter sp. VNH31]
MYVKEENNYPKALLISTGIMAGLIALSFLIVINSFEPEEEFGMGGIQVNYGTVKIGMGDDYTSIDEPSVAPNANGELPDKVTLEELTSNAQNATPDAKNVATQSVESSVALNSKNTTNNSSSNNANKSNTPQINQQALYQGKKNNGTGRGDGTGNVPGNQGDIDGDPLTPTYGEGGSGFGDTPIELGKFSNLVKPIDNTQEKGRVAIRITMNKQGIITNAEVYPKLSTTLNKELVDKSIKAMLGARYKENEKAPDLRRGIVVFNYGLN